MADRRTDQHARGTAAVPAAQGGAARRGAATTTGGGTEAKQPLTERISAAVSGAAREHRANAGADDQRADTSADTGRGGAASRGRGPRRARLRLARVDPWSVMKTAFLLSVALAVVTVVAVGIVWSVLAAAGVWESINATVADVLGSQSSAGFDVRDYIGTSRVLGFTVLVSVINVVLLTAIATLGAFLYNMAAALLGGIEVTLAEDER